MAFVVTVRDSGGPGAEEPSEVTVSKLWHPPLPWLVQLHPVQGRVSVAFGTTSGHPATVRTASILGGLASVLTHSKRCCSGGESGGITVLGPCRLSQARQGTGDMYAKKDEGCSSAVPGMGSRKLLFASSPRPAVPEGLGAGHFQFLCVSV